MRLILASASPRRRQLLAAAGYDFDVEPSAIDEPEPTPGVDPSLYVADLAWMKARAVAARHQASSETRLVLAADTTGVIDGLILNKPRDLADADRMIRLQEGRETAVLTGLCLLRTDFQGWVGAVETSVVRFRVLADSDRDAYLKSGRWEGKSGAYGVQDDDPFVKVISGSTSNVVGLPLERLHKLLRDQLDPAIDR